MNRDQVPPDPHQLAAELTPKQQHAAELYVAGPPDCVGNRTESYVRASGWKGSRRGASSKASALFGRPAVRAYVRALRQEGTRQAAAELREWAELAVDAQETLHRAATGQLPPGLSDEAVRSAVRAAMYVVDRAYGTPSQQLELRQTGGITVEVAGPATVGRLVELTDAEHLERGAWTPAGAIPAPPAHAEEVRSRSEGGPAGAPLLDPPDDLQ